MGGLFDRLQSQLENREKEGGITALDLASLPPRLRKIMRLMLREVEMTYPELLEAIQAMPEADRLSQADLDHSLETLSKQGWLIRLGVEDLVTYRVNLRRKAGSKLTEGIWSALDNKMAQKSDPDEEATNQPDQ